MEVTVKIEKILPLQSGVSKAGKEWRKLEFVGSTALEQYPKQIIFMLFNGGIDNNVQNIEENALVTISFDLESRAFVGKDGVERWSTDVKAFKVVPYEFPQSQMGAAPQQTFAPQTQADPYAQQAAQYAAQMQVPTVQQSAPQPQDAQGDLPF